MFTAVDWNAGTFTRKDFDIAFNDEFFSKSTTETLSGTTTTLPEICLSRDTYYTSSGRDSALFESDGSLSSITTGLEVSLDSDPSKQAWVSIHGLYVFAGQESDFPDGASVRSAHDHVYNVVKRGGHLEKVVTHSKSLGDFTNVPLLW